MQQTILHSVWLYETIRVFCFCDSVILFQSKYRVCHSRAGLTVTFMHFLLLLLFSFRCGEKSRPSNGRVLLWLCMRRVCVWVCVWALAACGRGHCAGQSQYMLYKFYNPARDDNASGNYLTWFIYVSQQAEEEMGGGINSKGSGKV